LLECFLVADVKLFSSDLYEENIRCTEGFVSAVGTLQSDAARASIALFGGVA